MNSKELISKDLIPVAHNKRVTGSFGYFNVWIGLSVIIATFAVGGEGIRSVTLPYVLLACIFGNILLGIFVSITGDIGTEHGIPFPIYIKALFGQKGIIVPSVLRAIYGAIWFGIQTYFGAVAINVIVNQITGMDNWIIWYVIFAIVQVINTAFGFKSIEKFANIASPAIIIISIYFLLRLTGMASEQNIDVWNSLTSGPAVEPVTFKVFFVIMILNMTYWASSSADSQNLTRYVKTKLREKNWFKRNKTALIGHLFALPLGQTFMIAVGAISMLVVKNWNPIEAMQQMSSGIVLIVMLIMIVFAQWSTNAAGNLFPPAVVIIELSKSRISYKVAVIITGIIGSITQPWVLLNNLSLFLAIIGTLWASFAGITFADYYLIRKRKLNVPDLYKTGKSTGQFNYQDGWNWIGILTLIVSMIAGYTFQEYSYFIGFGVSCALYFVLAKNWWFNKFPQAELQAEGDAFLGTTAGKDWVYDETTNEIRSEDAS